MNKPDNKNMEQTETNANISKPDLPGLNGDEAIEQVPLYKKKRVIIPLFILILCAAAGWWYWNVNLRGFNSTDDAYVEADRLTISTKMLGRITFLALAEGDTVSADQVIVKLDDSDIRAQEEQAKAAVASASQNVALAKVNLDKTIDDLDRAGKQIKNKVIPQEQFDHARQAREAAQAQYSIAIAQVGTAKAQLGIIETNLENTIIRSPMSGVVSKRWVLTGDVVQPAQPIYSLYNLKNYWVTANFEETKLSSIRVNDPVAISVDAYPDREFHGKVFQIGSNTASQFSLIPPNNASGNYTKITQRIPIKISVDDPQTAQMPLLPGMSVEVKIKVK
ncbi:MAG: HlyD family secretion protein [Bacteroidota bacterium]